MVTDEDRSAPGGGGEGVEGGGCVRPVESVVINGVYAKTGASVGAEKKLITYMLTRLATLALATNIFYPILFIEKTPNPQYLETGLQMREF
jgi:hypothetical protein